MLEQILRSILLLASNRNSCCASSLRCGFGGLLCFKLSFGVKRSFKHFYKCLHELGWQVHLLNELKFLEDTVDKHSLPRVTERGRFQTLRQPAIPYLQLKAFFRFSHQAGLNLVQVRAWTQKQHVFRSSPLRSLVAQSRETQKLDLGSGLLQSSWDFPAIPSEGHPLELFRNYENNKLHETVLQSTIMATTWDGPQSISLVTAWDSPIVYHHGSCMRQSSVYQPYQAAWDSLTVNHHGSNRNSPTVYQHGNCTR